MGRTVIDGVTVIPGGGKPVRTDAAVTLEADGTVSEITAGAPADGWILAPAAVDLHLDNLVQRRRPRATVTLDPAAVLIALDAECAAAGIATVCVAARCEHAPQKGIDIADAVTLATTLEQLGPSLCCDWRIHARVELTDDGAVDAPRRLAATRAAERQTRDEETSAQRGGAQGSLGHARVGVGGGAARHDPTLVDRVQVTTGVRLTRALTLKRALRIEAAQIVIEGVAGRSPADAGDRIHAAVRHLTTPRRKILARGLATIGAQALAAAAQLAAWCLLADVVVADGVTRDRLPQATGAHRAAPDAVVRRTAATLDRAPEATNIGIGTALERAQQQGREKSQAREGLRHHSRFTLANSRGRGQTRRSRAPPSHHACLLAGRSRRRRTDRKAPERVACL